MILKFYRQTKNWKVETAMLIYSIKKNPFTLHITKNSHFNTKFSIDIFQQLKGISINEVTLHTVIWAIETHTMRRHRQSHNEWTGVEVEWKTNEIERIQRMQMIEQCRHNENMNVVRTLGSDSRLFVTAKSRGDNWLKSTTSLTIFSSKVAKIFEFNVAGYLNSISQWNDDCIHRFQLLDGIMHQTQWDGCGWWPLKIYFLFNIAKFAPC